MTAGAISPLLLPLPPVRAVQSGTQELSSFLPQVRLSFAWSEFQPRELLIIQPFPLELSFEVLDPLHVGRLENLAVAILVIERLSTSVRRVLD
jgi:hypothetical protein